MASRNLDDLIPEVAEKARRVKEICMEKAGFELLIYCTLRPLEEQARLYRQSRSFGQIKAKMDNFRDRGFSFLADIIDNVGPCSGAHVTNAGPGESWHNYGEAWDAVPLICGKAAWSYQDAKEEWDAYGEAVREVGMSWAGDWTSFREFPHAQLQQGSNPLKLHDPEKIKMAFIEHKLIDPAMFA